MALYQNGTLISGANTLPQMTLAEYQALPVSERPTYWERTDLNYNNIPASDVTYGSGSVEDALDELTTKTNFSVGSGIALSANTPVAITTPSDGYLIIYSTNTDTRVLIAPNSALTFSFCIAQAQSSSLWGFDSIYIRKGATVYVSASGSHGFYCFVQYV